MQQYLQLFINSVQKKGKHLDKCFVVAFTSALPEEGVSYVAQSFGTELARRIGKRTLIADARRLTSLNILQYESVGRHCFPTDVPNLWSLPADEEIFDEDDDETDGDLRLQPNGDRNLKIALANLQTLRFAFDYVLLDCPALGISDEATFFAPETDGVMVVVEADRTKREQIQNTQRAIETANGNLLGFILNKRNYIVPNWLYQWL